MCHNTAPGHYARYPAGCRTVLWPAGRTVNICCKSARRPDQDVVSDAGVRGGPPTMQRLWVYVVRGRLLIILRLG